MTQRSITASSTAACSPVAQTIGLQRACWDCVHLWELRDLDTQAMCRRSGGLHFAQAGCRDFRLGVDDDGCREG